MKPSHGKPYQRVLQQGRLVKTYLSKKEVVCAPIKNITKATIAVKENIGSIEAYFLTRFHK